jgi:hypothetical protein
MKGARRARAPIVATVMLTVATAAWVTGCDRGDDAVKRTLDSTRLELERVQRAVAQRDSLMSQVAEATSLVAEIEEELAKVRGLRAGQRRIVVRQGEIPMPVTTYRDSLMSRVRTLRARLNDSEQRLAAMRSRLIDVHVENLALVARFDSLQRILVHYRATIDDQEQEIALLARRVDTLVEEGHRLTFEKSLAEERLVDAEERENTVYVLAGTRAQLLELGVVVEAGGGKRLFGLAGRRPGVLLPSTALDPADFAAASRTSLEPLPGVTPGKRYAVVSTHDASLFDPEPNGDGLVLAPIKIAAPSEFWRASKFLILVER